MNFKKIEVFGFKSFADRKIIEINDGSVGFWANRAQRLCAEKACRT